MGVKPAADLPEGSFCACSGCPGLSMGAYPAAESIPDAILCSMTPLLRIPLKRLGQAALASLLCLAAGPSWAAGAQAGAADTGPPAGRTERDGATLFIIEGRLLRTQGAGGAEAKELRAVGTQPLGKVWGLAADPSGLTYVAADAGVFVAAPGIEALERVRFREGAPDGAVRSVAVATCRRLWVGTDLSVGVVDPCLGWGRTLPASELPGEGPYRVSISEGRLEIEGSGGRTVRALGPLFEDGAPNGSPQVAADGVVLRPRPWSVLELPFGRVPGLTHAQGEGALGSAVGTVRYRVNGHHWLRDLADTRALVGLSPGVHRLEVFGFDSHLNRTAPIGIELRVAAPFYYRKWFLLFVVAGLGLAMVTFFVFRARARRTSMVRALGSSAILGAVCLQVAAGIWPHAKGWPFVGYSMYSKPFDPSGHVHEALLHYQDDRGQLHSRSAYSMGLAIDNPWQVLHPLVDGDGPAVERMWEIMPRLFPGKNIRSFQVVSERTKLTEAGPVAVPPLILAHFTRPLEQRSSAGEASR